MISERCCELLNAGAAERTRSVVVLGASGSVGGSTIEFLKSLKSIQNEANPEARMHLAALSVHGSVDRLREILREFPDTKFAAVTSDVAYDEHIAALRREFAGVVFFRGSDGALGMIEAAVDAGADTVLTAVVGAAGIQATMLALRLGVKVALANKETMVTAGPAIEALLRDQFAQATDEASGQAGAGDALDDAAPGKRPVILPVDSEHNAIFQVIHGLRPDHIRRVILTASGGPFRDWPIHKIQQVSRAEVLNHPTWSMGPKITVDSAGMINKGLELIEAHFLFSIPYAQLDVLIHKDSYVHGMAETRDGGYLLCASRPHMVFPIAHALCYPDPVPAPHAMATRPEAWPGLEFEEVQPDRYPGYALCRAAGERGGTAPAILNAANEEAVRLFLDGQIGFTGIPGLIESVLNALPVESGVQLEIFLEADRAARELARQTAQKSD
ncbi:MAG: 1-deoxy-D-xylulose-5-phosphate reductoisomerase [bacterium]|nr:1-deoxy-D-xylulose-5-phosphate reductoisomerase [bacterium]